MMDLPILQTAVTIFLVANALGNAPAILTLVKDYDLKKQKLIILREVLIAFAIAMFFQFFGEVFLSLLKIEPYTVSICGGILLLFVSIDLIFPHPAHVEIEVPQTEPFIVPIATPLLAGPGLLTMVMIFSKQSTAAWKLSASIALAWVAIVIILTSAPYLQILLGKRGMAAAERLMGLILTMISIGLIEKGVITFLNTFN